MKTDFLSRVQKLFHFIFQENLNVVVCWFILVIAGLLVYRNAFATPFMFDDLSQILQNAHIQSLQWPWPFLENNRRPILYASLAFDFHQYGFNAFGFHAFNIRVHILGAMFLFLIVRKTCLLPSMKEQVRKDADLFALSISLLWLVHPIQTQAVTYIIQRAESLMGLFFLSALYFSIKYLAARKTFWLIAATVCALLCGLTKEVALALPITVLLYDRTFISSTFREALSKNRWLYAGLGLMWMVMFFLYFTTKPEETLTAGFGMQGMTPWQYAINQPPVILQYLKLIIWPHPLIFDYEWPLAKNFAELWFPTMAVILLLVNSVLLYRRYPIASFFSLCFFVVLAPSSSLIPLKDIAFEYRVYLSLSCVIAGLVYFLKFVVDRSVNPKSRKIIFLFLIGLWALTWGGLTYQRNKIYLNEETLWHDVIKNRPLNARAYNNLGEYYLRQGRDGDAKESFFKSISVASKYPDVFANMSTVMAKEGKFEESILYAQKAIAIKPDFAIGYNNLGSALSQLKRYDEAVPYYQKTLQLGFYEEGVLQNLGVALANSGQPRRAILVLEEALRLNPSSLVTQSILAEVKENLKKD